MLRLGTKYTITSLRMEALRALHYEYPTKLEDWEASLEISHINYRGEEPYNRILDLALEFSLETILPAAYMHQVQGTPLVCMLPLTSTILSYVHYAGAHIRPSFNTQAYYPCQVCARPGQTPFLDERKAHLMHIGSQRSQLQFGVQRLFRKVCARKEKARPSV